MKLNKCPCCDRETPIGLVNHHWHELSNPTKLHVKKICYQCNHILSTDLGYNNHVLPQWDEQVKAVRSYLNSNSRQLPFRKPIPPTVIVRISGIPQSLLERIRLLADKRKWSINAWVVNTLDRESKPRK